MKKIYISGPITGIVDAYENFETVENLLKELDYAPVNPFKLTHEKNSTWLDYMKGDIRALLDCEGICMLLNWDKSKGAVIERELAIGLGFFELRQGTADHILDQETNLYVKKEISKGLFGGECYRASCNNKEANFFNKSTSMYYCEECAVKINHENERDSMRLYGTPYLCSKDPYDRTALKQI